MTKSEIVKEISARTGIDGKAVLAVVEGFMNEVKSRTVNRRERAAKRRHQAKA